MRGSQLFLLPGREGGQSQTGPLYSQWASRKVSTSAWATLAPSSRAVISPFRSCCRTTCTTCSCFTYCSRGSFKYSGRHRVIGTRSTLCDKPNSPLHFPGGPGGKELACQCRRHKRHRFNPWVGKIPWRRAWQPTPVFLPGELHGQRSLVGYNP